MFGELPKIFDRNFAIGYFLPAATFTAASTYFLSGFSFYDTILTQLQRDLLVGATTIVLASWLGGIVLLATNRSIIRLFEGYGKYNPFRLFFWKEKRKYKRMNQAISKLDEYYGTCLAKGEPFPDEARLRRNSLMVAKAEQFPDQPEFLLPTAFGNALRAFEVYPRVMYGFEAIQGWGRLLAIIPKDVREIIDSAKAQVDFWLNLSLMCFLFIIEYASITAYAPQGKFFVLPLLVILLAVVAFSRARSSVIEWGELVKSCFDVFLPKLVKEMGLSEAINQQNYRKKWTLFSQAITYRFPSAISELQNPESKDQKGSAPPDNK